MILKPGLGAFVGGDRTAAAEGAGDAGEDVDADELAGLTPVSGVDTAARLEMAGWTLTGSMPSRCTRYSRARTDRSAEGCEVAGVLERVMHWVARSR